MHPIILLVTLSLCLFADNNTSIQLDAIGQLGSMLEAQSTVVQTSVETYVRNLEIFLTILLGIISIFAYRNSQSLISRIERNKDRIHKITENLKEEVRYIDRETNARLKEVRAEVLVGIKDVKEDIRQEVSQQIVHVAKEKILEVEEYAYRKIESSIGDINKKVQAKLFDYQAFIYKVNEAKKIEYDEVIDDETMPTEEKLSRMIAIQSRYNEINNQSIPKLFSENIKEEVVSIAIKLSEHKAIKQIIIDYLEKRLLDENLSFADKARIKDVLHSHYQWIEPLGE